MPLQWLLQNYQVEVVHHRSNSSMHSHLHNHCNRLVVGLVGGLCGLCFYGFDFFSPRNDQGDMIVFFLGKDRRQEIPLAIGSVDSLQISIGNILHSTCTVVIGKI